MALNFVPLFADTMVAKGRPTFVCAFLQCVKEPARKLALLDLCRLHLF